MRRRFIPRASQIGTLADRCEVHHDARLLPPHGHDHHDVHAHPSEQHRLKLTLTLTACVLVVEVVGGLYSHSLALLSDAGHMLTDVSAQGLSLLALLVATRPADARRTYGYYRLEILAALSNGLLLLVLSGFLLYEAYQRITLPVAVRSDILLVVATFGLVSNLVGMKILHGAHSLNVRGAYLHLVSDALSSASVLVGAAIMALSGGLYVVDPILGVLIAILVIVSACRLIFEAADILLEAVPAGIDLEKVRGDIQTVEGIKDVHDLHIWTLTSGVHALSAHIVVPKGSVAGENDELLTRIKELLLLRHRIAHSTLQIESTEYEHVGHVH
jgi:cobalt-zinc-cadmium efflux system protein